MRTSRLISRSKIFALLIAAIAATTLSACTQAEGEPCQVNRDCDDGLVCDRETAADRGVCTRPEDVGDETEEPTDPDLQDAQPPAMPEDDAGAQQAGSSG